MHVSSRLQGGRLLALLANRQPVTWNRAKPDDVVAAVVPAARR